MSGLSAKTSRSIGTPGTMPIRPRICPRSDQGSPGHERRNPLCFANGTRPFWTKQTGLANIAYNAAVMASKSNLFGHASNASGLAGTAVLTALLDYLIERRDLERDEVITILEHAHKKLARATNAAGISVVDAIDVVSGLTARFKEAGFSLDTDRD